MKWEGVGKLGDVHLWGGGKVLHQIVSNRVQHGIKNWNQMDLGLCKNEGSKRYTINEKGGQFDGKSRRKLIQNA